MDKLKQLQEASERADRAQVAWAEYWAELGEADADPAVFDPLQIERVAARKAYSDAKEALARSILDGSFPDDETVERAKAAGKRFHVEGVVHQESCCSTYRVMEGCVAIGGDYVDGQSADDACYDLNIRAALQAALGGAR